MRRGLILISLFALLAALATGCGGRSANEPAPKRVFRHFHSRPDLKPPTVDVVSEAKGTAPGYIFIGPKKKKVRGPLIIDNEGNVVWFKSVPGLKEATDFRAQTYQGRPVLTWWQGQSLVGIGAGMGVVYDDSYRRIAVVRGSSDLKPDLHEFRITPRDTALVTIYDKVPADLSSLGGPKHGFAYDSVVEEIDIASGKVRFEWHSLKHVQFDESYVPLRKIKKKGKTIVVPHDYFHVNSVTLDGRGNYLISGRNTHALYDIAPSGKILWRLGGKRSDFTMGSGTQFAWQHDPELHPDGTLTLFDNEAFPKVGDHSRGLVLKPDFKKHSVRLVRAYVHPDKLLAPHQGNMQVLPDGHVLIGWGGIPYFTEFSEDGKVLWDAHIPQGQDSYRAYRIEWHGHPADAPKVAVEAAKNGRLTVYVSWNGATDVARWQVVAGRDKKHLKTVREADKEGFETQISVGTKARVIAVRALDSSGDTLGTSKPVRRP